MSSEFRSITDHRASIMATVRPLPATRVSLADANGLVLAEDVHSRTAIPPFDNSAMDGYAVQRGDLLNASRANPVGLRVIADLAAGTQLNPLVKAGHAARIMTGAPLPDGADAIVPIEHSDQGTHTVLIHETPRESAHIRRSGEDVGADARVLATGVPLTATRLAAAASAGHGTLLVRPKPRVAIISTGSELVTPGETLRKGQIPDSNSYLLAAAAADAGCAVSRVGAVADDESVLRTVLDRLAASVDVIVLSGGVSVGAYDVVKAVLAREPSMWFGPVRMQPGKPQGFGRLGSDGPVVFALPGNPVSSFVSFEVFVRPALQRLRGFALADCERRFFPAIAETGWSTPVGRAQYMPVAVVALQPELRVRPASGGGSGSHLVASLALAEGLAFVDHKIESVRAGDLLPVMLTT